MERYPLIILDTHVWIWWVNEPVRLPASFTSYLRNPPAAAVGICAISCWEVAKLVERGRLQLSMPVGEWLGLALSLPGVRLLPLSPEIAVQSTQLPGAFHKDPADQIIVATARVHRCPLATLDTAILAYPNVDLLG